MDKQQTATEIIMGRCFGGPLDGLEREILPFELKQGKFYEWADEKRVDSVMYVRRGDSLEWQFADMENIPDINPTTGRIVWFWPAKDEIEKMGLPFEPGTPYPAMVIKGFKDGGANLKVFTMKVDFVVIAAPYSRKNKTGCWAWPEVKKGNQ